MNEPVDGLMQAPVQPVSIRGLESIVDLVQAGGPVVLVLLGFSMAALTIIIVKLIQFHAARASDRRPVNEALALLQSGHTEAALIRASQSPNPAAQVLAFAIRGRRSGQSESRVREAVAGHGNDLLEELRGWFRALEVIASLAPLLGLLGTVLGMIEAFQNLEQAGSQVDPAILSGGIWEALLTTAVGLAVAIPTVAALNGFERVVERLAHSMESTLTQFFTAKFPVTLTEEDSEPDRLRLSSAAHG